MIGFAEILIVAVVIGLIYVSQRRGGRPASSGRERNITPDDRTTITVPRHLVTLLASVGLAVAAGVGALWMAQPPWVGVIAAGLVAASVATALASQGR